MIRYGSVCSGIEAATMAWHPLGWEPAFFSEIEKFPSAVLKHHYPEVPNLGDMTKYKDWPDHAIDLLVGGTPCQSFSIAGLRQGLADPRGNLMLTYLAIARRYQPRWLVWENVPGVLSSNGGRDFAAFIGGLEECGYHAAWRVLDAQFVRVDGFGRAVPQRRRRVFVVGYLGDWRRAAAVLLERESLSGNSEPRRQAGQGFAGSPARSVAIRGRDGTPQAELGDDVANTILTPNGGRAGVGVGAVLAAFGGNNRSGPIEVATAVNAHGGPCGRMDFEVETFVSCPVADSLTVGANQTTGFTGDVVAFAQNSRDEVRLFNGDGGIVGALAAEPGMKQTTYVATHDVAGTMKACKTSGGFSNSIDHAAGGYMAMQGWAVRRLTPTECERLQGFPDGFTAIPYPIKPAADGPRYKALGNSMAVNAMRWIGQRIAIIDAIPDTAKSRAAA